MGEYSYGWGIIGTGHIASLQTQDLLTADLRVAAVGSRTQESADAFADQFDIPNRHGSYADLAANPEVDIVYVATPNPVHADAALLAIEAGKHVLVEKPFTINAAEAIAVRDAAAARGVAVMEAMWTRFLPMMTRVFALIAEGAIGEPLMATADQSNSLPREQMPRLHEPELGGGALLDLGVYPISLASRLFGRPVSITARSTYTMTGVDAQDSLIFEYGGDKRALIHCSLLARGSNRASIIGTGGRIDIDPRWPTQTTFTRYAADGSVVERYEEEIDGRGMQFQALELERCIHAGLPESPVMPVAETIEIMRTMDAIRDRIGVVYPSETPDTGPSIA